MIRAALLHVVLGHAEQLCRGQLLQRRLPVKASAQPRRQGDHRVEEPVYQGVRSRQAEVEVDGADHGLERVGQDRGLVPAASALLALAEVHVVAQPEAPGHAREGAHVHHRSAQLR